MPVDPADDPRILDLLSKYSGRRNRVEGYIDEMETLKDKIIDMFPDTLDYKAKFYLEEKIKASASFYATLLSLTQEYNKTIVQEIDIIRKLSMRSDGKERDLKDIISALEDNNPELVHKLEELGKSGVEQITDNIVSVIEEINPDDIDVMGNEHPVNDTMETD